MNKQPWMLFRTQDCSAHYFWDGQYPVLVQVAAGEQRENHFWNGASISNPVELPEKWIKAFNETALSRKRKLQLPGHIIVFAIVEKGVFQTE